MNDHIDSTLISKVKRYYDERIRVYGAAPKGVDWKDEDSQLLRFRQLLEIIDTQNSFSLNDLGCGYGVIGCIFALISPHSKIVLTDINKRAIEYSKKNIEDLKLTNISNAIKIPANDEIEVEIDISIPRIAFFGDQ